MALVLLDRAICEFERRAGYLDAGPAEGFADGADRWFDLVPRTVRLRVGQRTGLIARWIAVLAGAGRARLPRVLAAHAPRVPPTTEDRAPRTATDQVARRRVCPAAPATG